MAVIAMFYGIILITDRTTFLIFMLNIKSRKLFYQLLKV